MLLLRLQETALQIQSPPLLLSTRYGVRGRGIAPKKPSFARFPGASAAPSRTQLISIISDFVVPSSRLSRMGFDDTSSLKPEKFKGVGFLRWQEQLEAWLITLGLITAIGKTLPYPASKNSSDSATTSVTESKTDKSPEEIEFHCRFRILSCLSDELYETYRKYKTAKDLWLALEDAYIRDSEGIARFTITDFNNFRMVDNIPINDQIHKFQNFVQEINRNGSTLDDTYQATCLLDKLPPSWSKFAHELRRTQETLQLRSVIQAIRIEDQYRLREVKPTNNRSNINLTEISNQSHESKPKGKNFKPKGKGFKGKNPNRNQNYTHKPNTNQSSGNKKKDGFCYVCGRDNHFASKCFYRKKEKVVYKKGQNNQNNYPKPQVNMVEGEPSNSTFRTQVEDV